jgi:hypothetical protein
MSDGCYRLPVIPGRFVAISIFYPIKKKAIKNAAFRAAFLIADLRLFQDDIQGMNDTAHAEEQEGHHQINPKVGSNFSFLKKNSQRRDEEGDNHE